MGENMSEFERTKKMSRKRKKTEEKLTHNKKLMWRIFSVIYTK